jgi:hypothetical protein
MLSFETLGGDSVFFLSVFSVSFKGKDQVVLLLWGSARGALCGKPRSGILARTRRTKLRNKRPIFFVGKDTLFACSPQF